MIRQTQASFPLVERLGGDPFDVRTQVRRVFIQGVELPVDDRHTRLHEGYRTRPKP